MLKEPAIFFQFCRDYMTACSLFIYVCGPNTPISVPVELLFSYLSSWQMFNVDIISCIVWETWKTQEIDEGLNFKARLSSDAVCIGTPLNKILTVASIEWVKKWERRKLDENVTKIAANSWSVLWLVSSLLIKLLCSSLLLKWQHLY